MIKHGIGSTPSAPLTDKTLGAAFLSSFLIVFVVAYSLFIFYGSIQYWCSDILYFYSSTFHAFFAKAEG
jgi:hypothetical protein